MKLKRSKVWTPHILYEKKRKLTIFGFKKENPAKGEVIGPW